MFPKDLEEATVSEQCWAGLIRGLAVMSVVYSAALVYLCLTDPYLSLLWR